MYIIIVIIGALMAQAQLDECVNEVERANIEASMSAITANVACLPCTEGIIELANPLCLTPAQLATSSCIVRIHASIMAQGVFAMWNNYVIDAMQYDSNAQIAYLIAAEGRIPRTVPCDPTMRVVQKIRYNPQLIGETRPEICAAVAEGCRSVRLTSALWRNFTDNVCNFNEHDDNKCVVTVIANTSAGADADAIIPTARCQCTADFTGSYCQFKKTDYCCGSSAAPGKCAFQSVSARSATAAARASWCGGLDVDCVSADGLAKPTCNCNGMIPRGSALTPYTSPYCHQSRCDDLAHGLTTDSVQQFGSCNERALDSRPGTCAVRCPATVTGSTSCVGRDAALTIPTFYCACQNVWPVFHLSNTGCRQTATPDQRTACGVEELLEATRFWSAACDGNGHCESSGCVCHHPEGVASLQCRTAVCDHCNATNSACSPTTGVCTCDEFSDGESCDNDRCAQTGGVRVPIASNSTQQMCACPVLSEWRPKSITARAGCVLRVPMANNTRCGFEAAYGTPTSVYATASSATNTVNFLAQCRCALVSRRDNPVVQDNEDPAAPTYGACGTFCAFGHSYRAFEARCCADARLDVCVCAEGFNAGGAEQDIKCRTPSCPNNELYSNGECICGTGTVDDPQLLGSACS